MVASGPDSIVELELVAEPDVLGEVTGTVVRDATTWMNGELLILTEDALLVYDSELRPSPLDDVMSPPDVTALRSSGDMLWLQTSAGTEVWSDGWLNAVEMNGVPLTGPFAVGGTLQSDEEGVEATPVVWTSNASGVFALRAYGDDLALAESRSMNEPTTLGVDGYGALWAAAGGELHRRDPSGVWQRVSLSSSVTEVYTNPRSPVMWARGDSAVFSGRVASPDDMEFSLVDGVPAGTGAWRVDDVGRLLVNTADGIMQVSVGRPVAILGIPDDGLIFTPTEMFIVPVDIANVADITATLNGEDVAVRDGPWRLTVDPVGLDAGQYDLQISVDYQDRSAQTGRSLVVANPTWQKDIFPLYQDHCSLCHVDGSGTVGLETPEAWELRFDDLFDRVERNNMPLGQEPLDDFQKTLIRAWGEKGFPR